MVGLSLVACTANPSRLEEISQRARAAEPPAPPPSMAVVGPELPPAPAITAAVPAITAPAPAGVDAALWRDIGWFPGDSAEISGFVGHDNQMLVRWAEETIAPEFPACGPLFAAVQRTYMVQFDDSRQATNVLFGAMTREQERACMQALLPGLGLTGEQDGDLTILRREGAPVQRAAWLRGPEGAVVVIEGDTPLERWLPPVGPPRAELLALVGEVDRSLGMWSAGLRDYGSRICGVESSGVTLAMATPAPAEQPVLIARVGLRFASPRAAEAAQRGAEKFAAAAPRAEEAGLRFSLGADGSWLRAELHADLTAEHGAAFVAWAEGVVKTLEQK